MSDQDFERRMREIQEQILAQAREIYSETAMDHMLHPRNQGALETADGYGKAVGSCGDTIAFWVQLEGDVIHRTGFEVSGCGNTVASASMTSELVQGLAPGVARRAASQERILEALGGLPPENEHCALIASRAMQAALRDCLEKTREPWKKLYSR